MNEEFISYMFSCSISNPMLSQFYSNMFYGLNRQNVTYFYMKPLERRDGSCWAFGDLFKRLSTHKSLIAVGLYRFVGDHSECPEDCPMSTGSRRYFVTCPREASVVCPQDWVLVFGEYERSDYYY